MLKKRLDKLFIIIGGGFELKQIQRAKPKDIENTYFSR